MKAGKVASLLREGLFASQVALVEKNPPAHAGDRRDIGSIPGSERSPRGGHGNPLLYSCLENLMDRGDWHGVSKSWTQLQRLSTYTFAPLNPNFMEELLIVMATPKHG